MKGKKLILDEFVQLILHMKSTTIKQDFYITQRQVQWFRPKVLALKLVKNRITSSVEDIFIKTRTMIDENFLDWVFTYKIVQDTNNSVWTR